MDGFEELSATPIWAKLKLVQQECLELQQCLRLNGLAHEFAYEARLNLTIIENQLRFHFKHKNK